MSQHTNDNLPKFFSEGLKKARGTRSQADFARFLGIPSQQTYQRYEGGLIPAGDVIHRIASRIGIPMEELLTGRGPSKQAVIMGDQIIGGSVQLPELTEDIELELAENARQVPGNTRPVKKSLIDGVLKQALELKKRYLQEDEHWRGVRAKQWAESHPEARTDRALKEAEISGLAQLGGMVALSELGLSPKAVSPSGSSARPGAPGPPAKDAPPAAPKPVPRK